MEASGSYDIVTTMTATDQRWVYDIRISGEDFHMIVTMNNGAVIEVIGVGGITHGRENGGEWEARDDIQLRNLYRLHPISEGNDICPNLGAVAMVGEEVLDSTPAKHFQLIESSGIGPVGNVDDSSVVGAPISDTWDLWVDSTGQLVQTKLTVIYPSVDDRPEIRVEALSVISGVGESNVITAPITITAETTPAAVP
jgi:hypothetical protein